MVGGEIVRVGEICAGGGGLSLGAVLAGHEITWAIEWDKDACATYEANLHDVIRADVREVDPLTLAPVDCLIGGPPCQGFSVAGKGLGKDDERNMVPEFVRFLEALRPAWFVMENVSGLQNCTNWDYLRGVMAEMRGLGYVLDYKVLNAADFGVPQIRNRLFIIGTTTGKPIRWPEPTHTDPLSAAHGCLFGEPLKPWVTVREALGWDGFMLHKPNSDGGGRGYVSTDEMPAPALRAARMGRSDEIINRPSVTASEYKGHTDCWRRGKGGPCRASDIFALLADVRIMQNCQVYNPAHGDGCSIEEPSPTVMGVNPLRLVVKSKRARSQASIDSPSVTIAADGRESIVERLLDRPSAVIRAGVHGLPGYRDNATGGYVPAFSDVPAQTIDHTGELHRPGRHDVPESWGKASTRVRRLTPQECAILQDFPRNYCWHGTKTSVYRQIGNAVPPGLAKAVMSCIG